jgi:hypothetical protein
MTVTIWDTNTPSPRHRHARATRDHRLDHARGRRIPGTDLQRSGAAGAPDRSHLDAPTLERNHAGRPGGATARTTSTRVSAS